MIMNFFYGFNMRSHPIIPEYEEGERSREEPEELELSAVPKVRAYPNPADDWVIFHYQLPSKQGTLHIFSTNGRRIQTLELTEQEGYFTWDSSSLQAGVYFYQLIDKDGQQETKQLVIQD